MTATAAAPRDAAADERSACVDAHGQAQVLRRTGRLRAARARLVTCSAASCPALVSSDCTTWLGEVEAEQPTVIVASHDEAGRDVGSVRVTIDGEVLTTKLDGRPLDVDPGEHVFRGQFPGGRVAEARVILRAAEKDRVVALDLPRPLVGPPTATPSEPVPVPTSRSSVPTMTFVLGGLGVVALGSFAFFGLRGRSDESNLSSTCRPNCAESDLDALRREYLAADISLGLAVVALGAATWIALTHRGPRDSAR